MLQYSISPMECPHCYGTTLKHGEQKFIEGTLQIECVCDSCDEKFIKVFDISYKYTWYDAPLKHSYVIFDDDDAGEYPWGFSMDLRHLFDEELRYGNGSIDKIIEKKLKKTKLKNKFMMDSEHSCFYIYFQTEKDGNYFIDWMNENYGEAHRG